jgi:RNA polymerase subunit RPABC4/transcription elongation factor Spt4
MDMINLITEKLKSARRNLTSFEQRPINRGALIVVIFLDLFVLISIFDGLDAHTKQLSSPDNYIPHFCRDIALNGNWNSTNRTEKLANIINAFTNSYVQIDDKKSVLHPACLPFRDLIDKIKVDKELSQAFENWRKYSYELTEVQRKVESMKGSYDTSLLEKMANQNSGQADVSRVKDDIRESSNTLNVLQGKVKVTAAAINENTKVELLWKKLEAFQETDREALRMELRVLNYWYPLKKLAMQLAFLLPLLGMLYVWNRASFRKNSDIQILISSHLMVVSFIPVFARIIDTIYEIIPKILLKKLIQLLEAANLVAVWYYIVIALAVGVALIVVYLFQKRIFSHQKVLERRLTKGQCVDCGRQLSRGVHFCPFCGVSQSRVCRNCDRTTAVSGKYCVECGSRSSDFE